MTLSFPIDILADFPGLTTRFEPVPMEEVEPMRGGRQISKDIGPTLWELDVESKRLLPSELKFWKARLLSLQGETFRGYDKTARYPIAYPRGSWPAGGAFDGEAVLANVTDNKVVTLSGLPAGYVGSVGDTISFPYGADSQALHMVMEAFVADGGGNSGGFEVRPHVRPGYGLGSPATDVMVAGAYALMVLIPGSVKVQSDMTGRGTVSFSGRQTL
jgi:hypothetical protein